MVVAEAGLEDALLDGELPAKTLPGYPEDCCGEDLNWVLLGRGESWSSSLMGELGSFALSGWMLGGILGWRSLVFIARLPGEPDPKWVLIGK